MTREEALRKVVGGVVEGSRQNRLIVEYDRRSSPALKTVLENNYQQMVARDQRLGRIFTNMPKPAFKRGKNIKELLCRAKLPHEEDCHGCWRPGGKERSLARP